MFYCVKTGRLVFEADDIMVSRVRPAAARTIIAVSEKKARLPKTNVMLGENSYKRLSRYNIKYYKENGKLLIKRVKGLAEVFSYVKTAAFYTVATIAMTLLVYGSVSAVDIHFAREAFIEGKPVGIIKNVSDFENLIENMKLSLATTLGKEVSAPAEPVYIFRLVFGKDLTGDYQLRQNILSTFSEVEEAYAIYVNDSLVCAALSEEAAKNALERVKLRYAEEGVDNEIEFADSVSIRKEFISVGYVRSEDGIFSALTSAKEEEKKYTVSDNDTIWGIASKFGMSVEDVFKLNDGMNETIHAGDEIIIKKSKPLLSVKTKYVYEGERSIPHETKEEVDSSLPLGNKKVVVAGVEGKKHVVEEVVKVNGEVVETNVISEKTLSQPVAAVVNVGTKKDLSTVAVSGRLARPVYGTISSRFGRRGRGYHSGIDIAAPTGTPIKAADGGTVSFAGWSGGYGYLVKINHGNGYETYYAHCSAILTSVGKKVSKGDIIAKVGNTGNSTGPHCHFEVRINGVAKDPSKYVN